MRYWEYLEKQRTKETRAKKRRKRVSVRPVARQLKLTLMERIILSHLVGIPVLGLVTILLLLCGFAAAAGIFMGLTAVAVSTFVFFVFVDGIVTREPSRKGAVFLHPSPFDKVSHA